MIVVHTNVVAYLLFPGVHTDAARTTRGRDPMWAASLVWRSEFRNVLALHLRQGRFTLGKALDIQDVAESLLTGREYAADSRVCSRLFTNRGERRMIGSSLLWRWR